VRRPRWDNDSSTNVTTMGTVSRATLGDPAPIDDSPTRTRILDAADSCFARFGVLKTTMRDIAAEADISRATLYRYFGDRDDLVLGVILREAGKFIERLDKMFDRQELFQDTIVEGILTAVAEVRADDRLALLFTPEAAGMTGTIAGASEALFQVTGEFLRPRLEAARDLGQLRADIELDDAVEWILRTILSLLTVSGPRMRTKASEREFIRAFVVPSLVVSD